jgi:2EXR family
VACVNFRRLVEVVGTFTRFMELPTELRTHVYEFALKFEKSIIPHLCDTTNKQSTKFPDGIDGAKKYTMSSSNQWRFHDDNNMHFEPRFGTEFNRFLQGH